MIQFAKVRSYGINSILVVQFYVLLNLIKIRSFDPLPLKLLLKDLTKPCLFTWVFSQSEDSLCLGITMWSCMHESWSMIERSQDLTFIWGFVINPLVARNLRDLIFIRLCSAPFRLIYTENGMPHINYTVWLNKMQILENVQSYSLFMMIQLKSFIKINIISYIMQYISDNQEI